jgi:hypothetical protein
MGEDGARKRAEHLWGTVFIALKLENLRCSRVTGHKDLIPRNQIHKILSLQWVCPAQLILLPSLRPVLHPQDLASAARVGE